MKKIAAITVLLLFAIAATAAGAADLGGSRWYFMAGGGVYELRLGNCGFGPCNPDTGEQTEVYDLSGAYMADLGAWSLEGGIFSISSLFRGILSGDGGMIVGEEYIMVRH